MGTQISQPVVSTTTEKPKRSLTQSFSNLTLSSSTPLTSLSPSFLSSARTAYESDPKNLLSTTVLSKYDYSQALVSREANVEDQPIFNVKISLEGKPVTNQKSSGRCWLFASTNVARIHLMKKYGIEEFELSQSYLYFYDTLEKSNYYLENMIDLVEKPLDSRLVQYLNSTPRSDGGQWDMAVNLIEKYGFVPQRQYPESFNSSNSGRLNSLLNSKLRDYTVELRRAYEATMMNTKEVGDANARKAIAVDSLRRLKGQQMEEVYRILSIFLGPPPSPSTSFTWEFYDKSKKLHTVKTTPLKFYKEVAAGFDAEDCISLINDPRNKYSALYTVDRLGNISDGRPVLYINTESSTLKQVALSMLKADLPVWFGCDVGACSERSRGLMDMKVFDLENAFGTHLKMTKAERLEMGQSSMTHAMVLTAAHVENGQTTRWRVENSWSETAGEKGYMLMTDDWFDEYLYQIVAPKKFVPKELLKVWDEAKPQVLPAWDPMGSLA